MTLIFILKVVGGQSYDDLWGLKKMQAKKAWQITKGEGIVIALIDTSVDYSHPDLKGNLLSGYMPDLGVNAGFRKKKSIHTGFFSAWHGTLNAGAIATIGNNNMGIIGMAPKSKIIPFVCGPMLGGGLWGALIAKAVVLATDIGVDVINIATGSSYSFIIHDVIKYAHKKDIVITIPAGNGVGKFSHPPGVPEVIVAGGITQKEKSVFLPGHDLDIVAPAGGRVGKVKRKGPLPKGFNILTLRPTNEDTLCVGQDCLLKSIYGRYFVGDKYQRIRGTCLASAYTAGVVALIRAVNPYLTNEQIRYVLRESADHIGGHFYFGHGRLNAYKAVKLALDEGVGLRADLAYKPYYGGETPKTVIRKLPIIGTASGKDFKCYRLEVKGSPIGPNKGKWIPISKTIYKRVENGVLLDRKNLLRIPPRWPLFRTLRLIVEGIDGKRTCDMKRIEITGIIKRRSSENQRRYSPSFSFP